MSTWRPIEIKGTKANPDQLGSPDLVQIVVTLSERPDLFWCVNCWTAPRKGQAFLYGDEVLGRLKPEEVQEFVGLVRAAVAEANKSYDRKFLQPAEKIEAEIEKAKQTAARNLAAAQDALKDLE